MKDVAAHNIDSTHIDASGGASEAAPSKSPGFWHAFIALSCILSSVQFMNTSVFPSFDGVFTYARDISTAANAVAMITIGVVATFRPAYLRMKLIEAICLTCMFSSCVLLPLALLVKNPVFLVLAACLCALGRVGATLSVGVAASRLSLGEAGVIVSLSFVVQCLAGAFAWLLPRVVGLIAYLVLPILAWFMSFKQAMPILDATEHGDAPSEFSITRPSSFLPLDSQLFVCIFLFQLAFGCSLRFGEVNGVPLPAFAAIVPVAIVAIYVVGKAKDLPSDRIVQVSVVLVVAGFLAAMISHEAGSNIAVVCLQAGNILFLMVEWLVLIAVAGRNTKAAVAVFAWGYGVSGAGSLIGAALGIHANHWAGQNHFYVDLVMDLLILAFVAYALIGLHGFSFKELIDGVTPVEEAVVVSPKQDFDERCAQVAGEYGLTPRELEVFQMLARGRDRTYIQEQLVVSKNTVKSHVKHIYAKLDIHTHQELIDLIDD